MNFPALLIILDGWGVAPAGAGNALSLAALPTFEKFDRIAKKTFLAAAGAEVGLPDKHQGSSEMGHLMIGAGKPVVFPQSQIQAALDNRIIAQNKEYQAVIDYCHTKKKRLHLLGLLSDRGVHAYAETCYQLLSLAKAKGVAEVAVHIIADGRDTLPRELPTFVAQLEAIMAEQGVGKIASLIGRYYAMDRDQRWDRVEQAYNLYALGNGQKWSDIHSFLSAYYASADPSDLPHSDEFIPPVLFDQNLIMQPDDGVIFWNFRVDRAIEITQAFCEPQFAAFSRPYMPLYFVATTKYYDEFQGRVAFEQEHVLDPLGKVLADAGIAQFRIAETEKWAYITKVLDGYQETEFAKVHKKLIASDKVATYDLAPAMQADTIADAIVAHLRKNDAQVIIANFANADMVGHTGNIAATIKAVEAVDRAIAKIDQELQKQRGFMCITADHGNCEHMLTASGEHDGSHTANQVPFYVVSYHEQVSARLLQMNLKYGSLVHVAPTFLDLLGVPVPHFMSSSLLV